jgi:hypothetical protein
MIQLVAKEKVATKKIKKKTPRKTTRIPVYVCSSDSEDDSSEDEDRGVSPTTVIDSYHVQWPPQPFQMTT